MCFNNNPSVPSQTSNTICSDIRMVYLRGGGRRAEKRKKYVKNSKAKSRSVENTAKEEQNSEDEIEDKPERHRQYFRRNRFSTKFNQDLRDLIADWDASWNNKTGYDLESPPDREKLGRPVILDAETARWFDSRKSLKKARSQISRKENNDSAADEAEDSRMKADAKRVQQLLGIR